MGIDDEIADLLYLDMSETNFQCLRASVLEYADNGDLIGVQKATGKLSRFLD